MMLYNRVSNAQQLQRRVAVSAPFLRPLTCHAAAEATPEASTTSVKVNEVYSGKVTKLSPVMASVSLDNEVPASLHISMISNERVAAIGEVFAVGDELKAVVVSTSKRGIQLSTKALELVPGQMKTDKQAVFASADKGLAQHLVKSKEIMEQRRQALSNLQQVGSVVTGKAKFRRNDGWLIELDGVSALVNRRNLDQNLERGQSVQILITEISEQSAMVFATARFEKGPDGTYQSLSRLRAKPTETKAAAEQAAEQAAEPAAEPASKA
ncbi:hypothetical protein QJQ45_002186 [Haematococcus lacustris]|nr:hypothetical protein QJQ45_002186 [Haematococcus lacustris]